jgi:hypothetical protein
MSNRYARSSSAVAIERMRQTRHAMSRARARKMEGCDAFAQKEIEEKVGGWQTTTAGKCARRQTDIARGR